MFLQVTLLNSKKNKGKTHMKILIGADIVPTKSNIALFSAGNAEELVGNELFQKLNDKDTYCIFNLEVPLCDRADPIAKCGPNLIAPTSTIAGYKALGVDLLTLANNHILDQGEQGLESTLKLLDDNGIHHLGAGKNLAEAAKPYFFNFAGKKVGVYACAEHEFTIAGTEIPGANPFDSLESPDHVAEMKQQCDYAIVLYHGGKEHYRYPSPNLQKVCRKLVDKGADLVVCQHSHCIGCEEKYNDGTIVYGQGNFLFDHSKSEYWQTSLLIQLDEQMNITYLPLEKKENTVRLASGQLAQEILRDFFERSNEIKIPGAIDKRYSDFARDMLNSYLLKISGKKSLAFRIINKLSGQRHLKWYLRKYDTKSMLMLRNSIECEAHNELFLCALKQGYDEKNT